MSGGANASSEIAELHESGNGGEVPGHRPRYETVW